ncbi:MAG: hypothetical protein MKZ95_13605, partial [Pirellulales bacterium]|nr:hypothetical protein [Pirellulales bacterium]
MIDSGEASGLTKVVPTIPPGYKLSTVKIARRFWRVPVTCRDLGQGCQAIKVTMYGRIRLAPIA